MHPISVRFRNSSILSPREPLRRYTQQFLALCLDDKGYPGAVVSVLYCSERGIQRLNREFLEVDKVTDVLSFPWLEQPEEMRGQEGVYVGDIVVCLPVCARQSGEHGRRLEDEVALLLVHGMLHLLGYDHDRKAKERLMWAETDRLLLAAEKLPKPQLKVAAQ